MATWSMHMMTSNNTAVSTSGVTIGSTAAIAFGSGDRDTFFNTIQVNYFASAIHIATVNGTTGWDNSPGHHASCTGNHLWCVMFADSTDVTKYYGYPSADGVNLVGPMTMSSATSGGAVDPFMDSWKVTSPRAYEGVCLKFTHGAAVEIDPITIHYGSGAAVTSPSIAAHLEMVELATSNTPNGWSSPNPSSKLSLTAHTVSKTGHHWWVAMSLKPTAVAFHSSDRVKVEATYF